VAFLEVSASGCAKVVFRSVGERQPSRRGNSVGTYVEQQHSGLREY
jgi:hypothetical protein